MKKSNIVKEAKAEFDKRLLELKEQLIALQHDVANESKSSAGDKHETARAMMNLEQEKLGKQFQELESMKERFDKIDFETPSPIVKVGSLVSTNKGLFLLSVGLGKVSFDFHEVILLSVQSPLGESLIGKSIGDKINRSTVQYIIEGIQ